MLTSFNSFSLWLWGRKEKNTKNQRRAIRREFEPIDPTLLTHPNLEYLLWVHLKQSIILPKPWTTTKYFSNSTGSHTTNIRFSPFGDPHPPYTIHHFTMLRVTYFLNLHISTTFYSHFQIPTKYTYSLSTASWQPIWPLSVTKKQNKFHNKPL